MDLVLMKIARTTSTIDLAIITTVTAIRMLAGGAASLPRQAFAFFPYSCSTCSPHESITGNGLDDLICSNGISYPNTQIKFNALVTVKVVGPAKGSVTLTATTASQIQGTITSGAYDPNTKIYSENILYFRHFNF